MRAVVVVTLLAVACAPAAALPPLPLDAPSAVEPTQNRFLPRIFGGDEDGGGNANAASDAELRIQQLEQQVRMLTGQVEELTFTVRRLEQTLQTTPDPRGGPTSNPANPANPAGSGAPPRSLGTLPSDRADAGTQFSGGPVDLSALNEDFGATPNPSSSAPATGSAPSASATPELNHVRDLQNSGRFSMAADAARAVLADNPSGPLAGEARFLLGEALLAQRDYRGAANQFLENYTTDPNGARAPESLLKLGSALNGLGENEAACSSLEELFNVYPNVTGSLRSQAEQERRAANCA